MRDTYIAGGESFLLTYAINSVHSYEETNSFYKQILRIKDCDSFPIVLVANKCDLEKQRQVPEEQAR
jgi:GTPase KRas protein